MDLQNKKYGIRRRYGLPEKYGDGRRTVRRDDNVYARMLTPSDQVRRLRRVLDVLAALASVLDGKSRVVDGRVQLDLAKLRKRRHTCL